MLFYVDPRKGKEREREGEGRERECVLLSLHHYSLPKKGNKDNTKWRPGDASMKQQLPYKKNTQY